MGRQWKIILCGLFLYMCTAVAAFGQPAPAADSLARDTALHGQALLYDSSMRPSSNATEISAAPASPQLQPIGAAAPAPGDAAGPPERLPYLYLSIFLGGLLIIALVRLLSPDDFKGLILSLFNFKYLQNLFNDGKFGFNITNLLLDLLSIAMFSLLLHQVLYPLQPEVFVWVAAFTFTGYFLKLIAIQFMASIFLGRDESLVHLLFYMLLNRVLGLLLLPALFVGIYQHFVPVPVFLQAIGTALFCIYMLWLLRLYIQLKSVSVGSMFHLFLYLCTVELSPLLILMKGYIL